MSVTLGGGAPRLRGVNRPPPAPSYPSDLVGVGCWEDPTPSTPRVASARDAQPASCPLRCRSPFPWPGLARCSLDGHAHVALTRTTPACPLNESITEESQAAIRRRVPGVRSVDVDLAWTRSGASRATSTASTRNRGYESGYTYG